MLRQIELLRRADLQMKRRPLAERDLLSTWPAVAEYLRARQGSLLHEEVRVLFMDGTHRLLRESCVARGELDRVELPVREIVARALSVEASGLILAHNHPSTSTEPSSDDVRATKTLSAVVEGLGMRLHDHLIVTATGWLSFRQRGYL